jgi:hypothetical protein
MKNEENQQNWSEVQKKKIHAREKFNKARKGKKTYIEDSIFSIVLKLAL